MTEEGGVGRRLRWEGVGGTSRVTSNEGRKAGRTGGGGGGVNILPETSKKRGFRGGTPR